MKKITNKKANKFEKILCKVVSITMIIMLIIPFFQVTFADESTDYDFWKAAFAWWNKQDSTESYITGSMLTQIANIVEVVGTGVIAIATVILGIRYLLGSAGQKADCKDNLITLFVASIFFFGWTHIRDLFITGASWNGIGANGVDKGWSFRGFESGDLKVTLGTLLSIITTIGKAVALIATVYIGIKFVFAGAEGKSEIKQKGIMYIIGIMLVFATLNVLTFVSNIANDL